MKPKTMVLLLVAIMCGLGAAYLTAQLSSKPPTGPELAYFWVPKKEIKAPHRITKVEEEFEKKGFPKDEIAQANWVSDPKDLKDVSIGKDLPAGLPVPKVALESNEPTLQKLKPGYRAISIGCSNVSGAGGFILPGNRVDMVCTLAEAKGKLSKIFLFNVLVLAVNDQDNSPQDKKTLAPGTVTVALKPAEAERLTWVSGGAQINLLLRRPDDGGIENTPGATSPWERKGPGGDVGPGGPGGDTGETSTPLTKVPLAKKDVGVGIEITDDNYESYFDDVEIPEAIALKALSKKALLEAKDRHFYNKLLAGNWPTAGNLINDGGVVVKKPPHLMVGRNGSNDPVSYPYDPEKKTRINLTTAPGGGEPAPAPAPGAKPADEGK